MNNDLRKITEVLLFDRVSYKNRRDAVHQLHDLFAAASDISATNQDDDIYLSEGAAISPGKAAFCLLEQDRTSVFLRGIYQAILQLTTDFLGEKIHILYAGCGPYATLLTPLTTFFSSDEVAFHLLDINEISLEGAKKLYNAFGLNDYVAEWILADATTYQVPQGHVRHLMIAETLQNALRREPQVAVMLNLVPQLPAKGLFIPEEISVSAKLLDLALESRAGVAPGFDAERINLGNLYSIGRENCEPHQDVAITIPREIGGFTKLSLLTNITTFNDEKLGIYNCSLNLPLYLFEINEHTGKSLRFRYRMGEAPGFEYEWVE